MQTAVVVARDDTPAGRTLVAYVKPKAAFTSPANVPVAVSQERLIDYLFVKLPKYMIPRFFIYLQVCLYGVGVVEALSAVRGL